MCINKKWIINKYTKKRVLVDCGVCPACQQAKANRRTLRINMESRFNVPKDWITLHCTLTYDNDNIPFIFEHDYDDFMNERIPSLPVYRKKEVKLGENHKRKLIKFLRIDSFDGYDGRGESDWLKTNFSTYPIRYRYLYGESVKGSELPHLRQVVRRDVNGEPIFKKSPNRIGVIYYKDIQNWIKNFREYLKNHYKYESYKKEVIRKGFEEVDKFSFFACGEYGPDSFRPHFHILLHFNKKYLEEFKQAIAKTWKFDNLGDPADYKGQFYNQVKLHNRGASYVSTYVNRSADFPLFFATFSPFKPKHCYSLGYGMVSSFTKLPYILECMEKGRFLYKRTITIDGVERVVELPLPSYVINRFFPKFKGYSRLDDIALYRTLQRFANFRKGDAKKRIFETELAKLCDYDDDDLHKSMIYLTNSCKKFCDLMHYSYDVGMMVYADYYIRVWNRYYSFLNIYAYESLTKDEDLIYHFDNWYDGRKTHDLVKCLLTNVNVNMLETDVNKFPYNVSLTNELNGMFDLYKKKKKVRNNLFSINSNV